MAAITATTEVGETIPPLTAHAVSVSLPTWKSNVSYEEGEEWVLSKMKTGYPRFFIHKSITQLAATVVNKYGVSGEQAILFPSNSVATRCKAFFQEQVADLSSQQARIIDFVLNPDEENSQSRKNVSPNFSALLFPAEHFGIAKQFWQHSGDGISSRRAEFCLKALEGGLVLEKSQAQDLQRTCKGPKRYRKKTAIDPSVYAEDQDKSCTDVNGSTDRIDPMEFVEERFGRNLEVSFAANAKLAIRRRITGSLTADVDLNEALEKVDDQERKRNVEGLSEDDVYLYPTGMSAIFNTHQGLMKAKGRMKSIIYGFPYVDTLKIVQKFGPGCLFYGYGSSEDLDDLEQRLENGERYLALFTEFPGNPLLKTPDLQRIRALADKFDFCVVVDETIGNFLNVNVLPHADVVVSSLTKVFSGDSNVMGGSAILNPKSLNYKVLQQSWATEYEDNYWAEDSIFLERNSRDFVSRIDRINSNAEALCEMLRSHPRVKQVNYPKYNSTRQFYDYCRNPNGGYGGLLSVMFHKKSDAITFFDHLETAKGPSLGTNFTLSSPYVILAHYSELPWAASFGVGPDLIRFSVGLEDTGQLRAIFRRALDVISEQ
ncbi:cystathionine gamma-synthase-like protein [Patellaria atrata CBS 101060]|uniref:cystathionine gamma-synthase n=1 Tax=Patellaria atrata CBS 101060 TaxID=1346257 RepID=A0A9P4VP95_9PEZI|nr:cystathionine gamma-synthase-like protein [Patellaria atrata CBS 101060]